jgi:hypothetical protein
VPKRLKNLRIDDVSSVDKGAGHGVKVLLMKRDAPVRRETMASIESISKALYKGIDAGTVGYSSMLQVAKQLSPGHESDAVCFTKAYASGSASRVSNGPQILAAHLAKAKFPGHGDSKVSRPNYLSSLNGNMRRGANDLGGGTGGASSYDPTVGAGYDALGEWNNAVAAVQRQQKCSMSQAVDYAMKDPSARAHLEAAKLHGQTA